MANRHTASRRIEGPRGAIMEAAGLALRDMGVRPAQWDSVNGRILAFSGLSVVSYGEKLEIEISEALVTVTSSCQMAMTVVDWGKNKKNVATLLDGIERILPQVTMNYGLVPPPIVPAPSSQTMGSVGAPPVVVPPPAPVAGVPAQGDPMSLLHARYLRGELTLDEFERLQAELLARGA